MVASSRFVVAVHVLTLLAYEGDAVTSDYIAGSVNTNAVVIRRILGLLAAAGFVSSVEGAGGGTKIAKNAGRITLADVYRAVEGEIDLFGSPRSDPNPHCTVGRIVQAALRERTSRIESTVEREMGKTTIADLLADVYAGVRK